MTAQVHEMLVLDGAKTSMAFCPPIPADHSRVIEIDRAASGVGDSDAFLRSTACWRGYQGSWEIKDGMFYLVGLRGRLKLLGEEPLLADWFSGILRIPRGQILKYIHMGFGTVYEEEIHIKIERGLVISSRVIDNRGKEFDEFGLGLRNLPGGENRFPGDDE